MTEHVKIAWNERYCRSIDRIPLEWFAIDGPQRDLTHDVFEGRWHALARFDLFCSGKIAELNYENYPDNKGRKILLGTMRLHFVDQRRASPRAIEWMGQLNDEDRCDSYQKGRAKLSVVDDATDDLGLITEQSVSKLTLIEARLGQGEYRRRLLERWGGACAVTGITVGEMLRASHIKAWCQCKDRNEKLDADNGLLLSANLDALFDRYLLTFTDEGGMLLSDLIPESERRKIKIELPFALTLNEKQREYMAHHRNRFRQKQ